MNAHRGEAPGAYSASIASRGGSYVPSDRLNHVQAGGTGFPPPPAQLAHGGGQGLLASQDVRGRQQQQHHQLDLPQQTLSQPPTHTLLLRNPTGNSSLSHLQQQQFDALSQSSLGLHQQHLQPSAASAQQRGQQQQGMQQQAHPLVVPAASQSQLGNSSATAAGVHDVPNARMLPLAAPQASFPALPWEYLDAEEVVQGPFESSCLVRWFREGHFNSDVLVRAIGFYWTSLGLVITQLESRPPPTAAMHSTTTSSLSSAAAGRRDAAPVAAGEGMAATTPAAAVPVEHEGQTASAVSLFFCDNSPELQWTYLDDSGSVQGGFSSASMMDWFQGGYLRLEVPVGFRVCGDGEAKTNLDWHASSVGHFGYA